MINRQRSKDHWLYNKFRLEHIKHLAWFSRISISCVPKCFSMPYFVHRRYTK